MAAGPVSPWSWAISRRNGRDGAPTLFTFEVLGRDMNVQFAIGLGLTVLGLLGYLVGIETAYPGRAFAVTVVMVGVTLAAIGRSAAPERSA